MEVIIMKADKECWYCNFIGKTFNVVAVVDNGYMVKFKSSVRAVNKSDCEVI